MKIARIALILLSAAPLFAQTLLPPITKTGLKPYLVAVYETGNKIFVADHASGNVYMFDGSTHAELASAFAGTFPRNMVVHEGSGRVFLSLDNPHKIAVLNAATGAFLEYLDLPYTNITRLLVDETSGKVWTSSSEAVRQIDVVTLSETTVAGVSGHAFNNFALNPVTHELFVTEYISDKLQIVNGTTLGVTTVPNLSGLGVAVNWQENKATIATGTAGATSFRIYDRDTGTNVNLVDINDATELVYDSARNRLITNSEVNGYSTLIEANDSYFNLPIERGAARSGLRALTGHVYYAGIDHVTMMDQATQTVIRFPLANPYLNGLVIGNMDVNQTTGRIYVIADGDDVPSVTVVQDTDTLIRPPIFVGSKFNSVTHILDPLTMSAVAAYDPSFSAHSLAVRPGGGRLYVPTFNSYSAQGEVHVHAGSVGVGSGLARLLASVAPNGNDPAVVAVTPDGSRLYVSSSAASPGIVNVIDTTTHTTITDVTAGTTPWGVAVTPDGARVLVANKGSNSVSVIATATNNVTATIPVGSLPYGVAVHPAGRKAYVANSGGGTVSVIDLGANAVTGTITAGATPHWLGLTPDGRHLYVSNSGSGTVSIIDTGTDAVIQTVTMPAGTPEGIAANPDGSKMYVAGSVFGSASSVVAIDTTSFVATAHPLPSNSRESIAIAMSDPTARIAGRITSGAGGVAVSGATVRALQSGVERRLTTTNAAGDYSLFNLQPGTYDVEVSKGGFVASNANGMIGNAGRVTFHSAVLSPEGAACVFEVTPMFANHAASASSGTIAVSVSPGCAWTASTPGGSFVSITGGSPGNGNDTVSYDVQQNSTTTARSTTIALGGVSVAITQSGAGVTVMTLNAAATASSVGLSWTAVSGATSYEVWRSSGGAPFVAIGATSGLALSDSSVSGGTANLYRVHAIGAGGLIGFSNIDLAVVFNFTSMLAGVTPIRALHFVELRGAINAGRAALGSPALAFTDPSLAGVTVLRTHLLELRSAVDRVRATAGLPASAWTDPAITAGSTLIRTVHLEELRSALR